MPEILRDYFEHTVKPTVNEYLAQHGCADIRKSRLAAIVIEHIIDYYALAYQKTKEAVRSEISTACPSYPIVRSAADATKHRSLHRKGAEIKESKQVICPPRLFDAPFEEGCFMEAIEIYVLKDSGEKISLEKSIKEVMSAWEEKISPTTKKYSFN